MRETVARELGGFYFLGSVLTHGNRGAPAFIWIAAITVWTPIDSIAVRGSKTEVCILF